MEVLEFIKEQIDIEIDCELFALKCKKGGSGIIIYCFLIGLMTRRLVLEYLL